MELLTKRVKKEETRSEEKTFNIYMLADTLRRLGNDAEAAKEYRAARVLMPQPNELRIIIDHFLSLLAPGEALPTPEPEKPETAPPVPVAKSPLFHSSPTTRQNNRKKRDEGRTLFRPSSLVCFPLPPQTSHRVSWNMICPATTPVIQKSSSSAITHKAPNSMAGSCSAVVRAKHNRVHQPDAPENADQPHQPCGDHSRSGAVQHDGRNDHGKAHDRPRRHHRHERTGEPGADPPDMVPATFAMTPMTTTPPTAMTAVSAYTQIAGVTP